MHPSITLQSVAVSQSFRNPIWRRLQSELALIVDLRVIRPNCVRIETLCCGSWIASQSPRMVVGLCIFHDVDAILLISLQSFVILQSICNPFWFCWSRSFSRSRRDCREDRMENAPIWASIVDGPRFWCNLLLFGNCIAIWIDCERLVILCSFAIQLQSSLIVLIDAIIGSIGWAAKSEARFWVDCRIANGLRWIYHPTAIPRIARDCAGIARIWVGSCGDTRPIAIGHEFWDNFARFGCDSWIS